MRLFSKIFKTPALLIAVLLFHSVDASASLIRAGLTAGGWSGAFTQYGNGQSTSLGINPAIGIEAQFGFSILNFVFIEWSPTWLWVQKFAGSADKTNDSSYFSWMAGNVGVAIPLAVIVLEPYAGLENGTFGFSSGTGNSYSGLTPKLGLAVRFSGVPVKVSFEFRRHYFSSDSGGGLPSALSTTLNSYFLGLGVGIF